METTDLVYRQVIALVIILNRSKGDDELINSYLLCRQLSRIFAIIDCVDVSNSLKANGYAAFKLDQYSITEKGRVLIRDNKAIVLQTLDEDEYIKSNFQREMIDKYWGKV